MKKADLILFAVPLVLCLSTPAFADSSEESKESSNFKKTERFLPGEEVVTPTGKKMKVWSTEGPVPVSKAPEPFDDDAQLRDVPVVIDYDRGRSEKRHHESRPRREAAEHEAN
ncbi:MAG: hypothetical protein KDD66_06230 [Bdellovibrionales bacterium]|nr:hypothetical protein [Bdellovibrionales bacterium]